jgi:hypothetical protein
MPRYVFGPPVGTVELVAPGPVEKADVAVAYVGSDPEGRFTFAVPAYTLDACHQLDAIHLGLYESEGDVPKEPADVLAAEFHFAAPCASRDGGDVVVDATSSPVGHWFVLAVLEFAD